MVGNLKTFGKSEAKRDLNLVPILGDPGAVSRWAGRKGAKNVFIAPFSRPDLLHLGLRGCLVPRVSSLENEKTLGVRERCWFQTSR